MKFCQFWPPCENLLATPGKSTIGPPWKKNFRRPCSELILHVQLECRKLVKRV